MLQDRGIVGMKKNVVGRVQAFDLTFSMAAPTIDSSGVHSPPLAWREPVF